MLASAASAGAQGALPQPEKGRYPLGDYVSATPAVVMVGGYDTNFARTNISAAASEFYVSPQLQAFLGKGRTRVSGTGAVEVQARHRREHGQQLRVGGRPDRHQFARGRGRVRPSRPLRAANRLRRLRDRHPLAPRRARVSRLGDRGARAHAAVDRCRALQAALRRRPGLPRARACTTTSTATPPGSRAPRTWRSRRSRPSAAASPTSTTSFSTRPTATARAGERSPESRCRGGPSSAGSPSSVSSTTSRN